MRILGIDPGSRITGYGIVQVCRNGKLAFVAAGCIRVTDTDMGDRVKTIYDGLSEVMQEHKPDMAAIEKVFMAKNADSALKLGQARGVALSAAVNHDLAIEEYTALQIKRAVVGKGNAAKDQVQHMVKILLALSAKPQNDAADALACAICHANQSVGMAALVRASRGTVARRVI